METFGKGSTLRGMDASKSWDVPEIEGRFEDAYSDRRRNVAYLVLASASALVLLLVSDALSYSGRRYRVGDALERSGGFGHRTHQERKKRVSKDVSKEESDLEGWMKAGRMDGKDVLSGTSLVELWNLTGSESQCDGHGQSSKRHLEQMKRDASNKKKREATREMRDMMLDLRWKESGGCTLLERHCLCNRDSTKGCRWGDVTVDVGDGKRSRIWLRNLPSLPEGYRESWGRCAIVGNDQDVLELRNGYDISHHDTVVRIGQWYVEEGKRSLTANSPPILGFQEDVGIKTDVTYLGDPKRALHTNKKARPPLRIDELKHYLSRSYNRTYSVLNGKPVLTLVRSASEEVRELLEKLILLGARGVGLESVDVESSLLEGVFTLLRSNLCRDVDVYGSGVLTTNETEGTNYYWWAGEGAPSRSMEETQVEFMILNAAMQAGMLCTYV